MPSMCWYTFTFARPFQWGRLSLRRTDSDSLKFKWPVCCGVGSSSPFIPCKYVHTTNNNKKRPHQTTLASNAGSGGLRCVLIVVFVTANYDNISSQTHADRRFCSSSNDRD